MKKGTRSMLVVLAGVALMFFMIYGYTRKNIETAVSEPQVKGEPAASRALSGGKPETVSTQTSSEGDSCRGHRYYIAPGETASVTFETLVDADTAKIANEEPPTVQKEDLEAIGYSVSYFNRIIDTFSLNLPVWTVFEPDFAVEENATILYFQGNGARIDWKKNGEGTITEVPGVSGRFAVGKLSFDALAKGLGGKSVISIQGPNKKLYSLTPAQKNVLQEFHILTVTLDIKAPEKDIKGGGITHGSVLWKGRGIEFSRDYESANQRYVITGPGTSRACFE